MDPEKRVAESKIDFNSLHAEDLVNASGHVQELDRTWGIWSIASQAIISDNAWGAGAGSLVLALHNGGGPGVLYGLMAASFFYAFICAGLSELSSAMPTSANVYHWASVTAGPKYSRACSWYAGWWNCVAWIFGCSSTSLFAANAVVAMYNLYHPEYVFERWHVFIAFLFVIWTDNLIVMFGQKYIARCATVSGVICVTFFLVSLLTVAILPSTTGAGYASNAFVWVQFQNLTGWSSNSLVFLMGMLNGAYALYSITSLDDVFASTIVSLPLAEMYRQATRSDAGTMALLFIFFLNILLTVPGAWITAGRMLWTLGRDDATPFPKFIGKVSPRFKNPLNAQLIVAICGTILGAIYVGSATAFNAFVASFAVFTTMSYLAAILPHLLTRRKYVKPGPFWIPGIWAYIVKGIACAYILVFNVIYMFPYTYPVASPDFMNWTSVIFSGITFLLTIGYFWKSRTGYVGPRVVLEANDDIMKGVIGLDQQIQRELRHD
ncbi:Putative amino acid/polyamine transporter I [Septoria linicola]|uniref:Amino acid/polyamine transporter I n=1 Tax=Septoria linicola TaxID=215465 RepID=A0A9Q9AT33_9PEZI|nr:Putative amino acid/polyamine transporter I [Septoria linicola]